MSITAAMVKDLRERTGAGMMECKKALVETNGDIDAAIELMRKTGLAKADKKAGRTAAEGLIAIAGGADNKQVAVVEVNCETDFVAKGDEFPAFCNDVAKLALDKQLGDVDSLLAAPMANGSTVAETLKSLIAKIGENMNVRRVSLVAGDVVASYSHGSRIGVVVSMEGGDEALGRDIAMHIAASRPQAVSADEISQDLIEKEKEIFTAQAAESGKPAEIIEKMIDGRINKFLKEITLLGQPFVKDPDTTVEKLLKGAGAKVVSFTRFEVGEGIEKKQENFADEVMAQVKGS
ncbi:MAG: translation elongation factor Ts [Chromatiales bacterium]|nr:elongation factor Ts [Gammaproteobacteria bacterium]MBW6475898.1 translation elongation factor Ts [Chromatiales bacterium]